MAINGISDWIKNKGLFSEDQQEKASQKLADTWVQKTKIDKAGREGDTALTAQFRVTSKDGIDTWYELTVYNDDLEQTLRMVKTLQGLAVQIPHDQLAYWYADGTTFRKGYLPNGQTNMLALNRYDPIAKKWQAISTKDRYSVNPTISEIDGKSFWYFSLYLDDLAAGPDNKEHRISVALFKIADYISQGSVRQFLPYLKDVDVLKNWGLNFQTHEDDVQDLAKWTREIWDKDSNSEFGQVWAGKQDSSPTKIVIDQE